MDSYSELLDRVNNGSYFAPVNHIQITRLWEGRAEGVLEVHPDSLNPLGIVHGGALVTLADSVAGTAAFTTGRACVTLDCTMHYLSPAAGRRITCLATPKKTGKTILVYDTLLTDEEGNTVATGTYTFYAKGPADLSRLGQDMARR